MLVDRSELRRRNIIAPENADVWLDVLAGGRVNGGHLSFWIRGRKFTRNFPTYRLFSKLRVLENASCREESLTPANP